MLLGGGGGGGAGYQLTSALGTGHRVITRGGWRINEISSTYFHTLPKTYGKMFVNPFNVGENFHTSHPLLSLILF